MSSRALQASVHWSATTAKHAVRKRSQDTCWWGPKGERGAEMSTTWESLLHAIIGVKSHRGSNSSPDASVLPRAFLVFAWKGLSEDNTLKPGIRYLAYSSCFNVITINLSQWILVDYYTQKRLLTHEYLVTAVAVINTVMEKVLDRVAKGSTPSWEIIHSVIKMSLEGLPWWSSG